MSTSQILFRIFGALIMVAMLVAGAFAVYQLGVNQGAGLPAATAPTVVQTGEHVNWVFPFWGFGLFFKIAIGFFLFFFFIRMFWFGAWMLTGGGPRHWGRPPVFYMRRGRRFRRRHYWGWDWDDDYDDEEDEDKGPEPEKKPRKGKQ